MGLLGILYRGLYNSAYLIKSCHSSKNKVRILLSWVKINLKFLTIAKLFKIKTEKIFGYKLYAFDYGTIRALFEEIFYRNDYQYKYKNKKPVILDCGANIGFATIYFKWLYPESKIYAFEPNRRAFGLLKKNILENKLKDVHPFNVALSDRNGEIDFFIDSDEPGSITTSTKYERMPKDKTRVDCVSLSSFIKRKRLKQIDFAKMDIEGSEQEVVDDLNSSGLLKNIPRYTIEYHHKIGDKHKSGLSKFLKPFEDNKFEYQIDTRCNPINSEDKFQDILIYFYRK